MLGPYKKPKVRYNSSHSLLHSVWTLMATPPRPQLPLSLRRRKPVALLSLAKLLLALLLILVFFNTFCLSQNLIEYLPGFSGKLPFKLETGYIGVGEEEEVQLFYYFIESESNPEKDPLLLWYTGGPGCTCLFGNPNNVGPLIFDPASSNGGLPTLMWNDDAWTKVTSIIFIDQPVGTGFSYAKTSKAYHSNDTLSAAQSYDFLRKWLINHPKYVENPLYIGGDSYAGITVSLVVNEVYNGNEAGTKPLMNIKGYVLGNPYIDFFSGANEKIPYAHRMGFLSDRLYKSAKVNCHGNYVNVDPENALCLNDLEKINQCLAKINDFMILEPFCEEVWKGKEDVLSSGIPSSKVIPTDYPQSVVAPLTKQLCSNADFILPHTWANDKSVQKALYVREGTKEGWICNKTIKSCSTTPDGTAPFVCNVESVFSYHKDFTRKNCRALFYSGDHDMGIPHTSTEKWIESLKIPILSDWRPWFVQRQIAGYTMTYGQGGYELTYATVKGAGHVAPQFKPEESSAMIIRWLHESTL